MDRKLVLGMPTLVELGTLEENCALCRELGLSFVEINMSFPAYQIDDLKAEELNRLKDKYGIFFTIHADESFDPTSVNPRILAAYVGDMVKTIELAKEVKIPSINMHLLRGIYVTLPDQVVYVYGENEDFYLEKMKEFRDKAEKAAGEGVFINVENTDGYQQKFLMDALDLLLESPAFGLTIDIGHDHAIEGKDLPVILERKDRLHHMHMHDGLGKKPHLALGDGEIDLDYFLALAKETSSRVVLETKTIEALRKSAAYLKARNEL